MPKHFLLWNKGICSTVKYKAFARQHLLLVATLPSIARTSTFSIRASLNLKTSSCSTVNIFPGEMLEEFQCHVVRVIWLRCGAANVIITTITAAVWYRSYAKTSLFPHSQKLVLAIETMSAFLDNHKSTHFFFWRKSTPRVMAEMYSVLAFAWYVSTSTSWPSVSFARLPLLRTRMSIAHLIILSTVTCVKF